ncbi:MAG: HAMP domain-containing sensor histidine kinase [Candidatus Nitrosopolaris sp.]
MQREFLDIAAHELRTPIEPILGLTEILRSDQTKDRAAVEELLDVIARNAKRLHRLADDILDVTKIASQSLELKKELINVNDVISNTVQEINNQIDPDVKVELVFIPRDNDIISVEADKARLTQVIFNLLTNAVKFTKKSGGTVSITLEEEKKDTGPQKVAVVTIKDSGTGINQEILPRLFEKFASKSSQGTGLGLFISKSIIEAHGGKIWAKNNTEDKGAPFAFSLPSAKTRVTE